MKRARARVVRDALGALVPVSVILAGVAATASLPACRQNQPPNEPRPTPNSPIPDLDRPSDDPTTSGGPSLGGRDGG